MIVVELPIPLTRAWICLCGWSMFSIGCRLVAPLGGLEGTDPRRQPADGSGQGGKGGAGGMGGAAGASGGATRALPGATRVRMSTQLWSTTGPFDGPPDSNPNAPFVLRQGPMRAARFVHHRRRPGTSTGRSGPGLGLGCHESSCPHRPLDGARRERSGWSPVARRGAGRRPELRRHSSPARRARQRPRCAAPACSRRTAHPAGAALSALSRAVAGCRRGVRSSSARRGGPRAGIRSRHRQPPQSKSTRDQRYGEFYHDHRAGRPGVGGGPTSKTFGPAGAAPPKRG